MKAALVVASLIVAVSATAASPNRRLETSLQTRVGYDSNPLGTEGTSALVLGDADTLNFSVGASLGLALSSEAPSHPTAKLTYSGETTRFDEAAEENFTTHRFGVGAQASTGPWKFTFDGSSLFVDGSTETLLSVGAINANSIPLWRERRCQWQHRIKLQSQATVGTRVFRGTATFLDYDYRTRAMAGRFAFADRSEAQAAVELGWKQNPGSLWLGGIRVGRQNQAIVPLPNCEFDYSNDYYRLTAGWEGKLSPNTTIAFAAGPDFRYYSGAIDPRLFTGGRNRTSSWLEASLTTKLSSALTLTGKAMQFDWLSSTGKSAYTDSGAEAALSWSMAPSSTLRLSAKVHRCDYFPSARDDWECLVTTGATFQVSAQTMLLVDLTNQRAWNGLADFSERAFHRFVLTVAAVVKL